MSTRNSIALLPFYIFFFLLSNPILSQELQCGTSELTPNQAREIINEISQIALTRNAGTTKIPIRAHIFRADNGTGGVSNDVLARGLANLNNLYLEANIEFYYCGAPNYINNTDLYEFDGTAPDNDTEADLAAATVEANDAVNIFYVNSIITASGFPASGYAYFPCNSAQCNRVVMDEDIVAFSPNGTYAHEFGHYFSLQHTHRGTENGNNDPNAENVARNGGNANCTTHGDFLCGTDADPRYNSNQFANCLDTGGETDINGAPYIHPVDNIMSYYPDACGGLFEADQYTRIEQGLVTRQGHNAYSFNCVPEVVALPTGLTTVLNPSENGIILNWIDQANNELGYLIERSTVSAVAGFQALIQGGVADGITTFTDNNINPSTTYWYRVKPINGNADLYSNVSMAIIGLIYCPASGACDEFISDVDFLTITNPSACSAGGYGLYTALSTDLVVGASGLITITNGNPYLQDQCGVWVDWNQDGDFEDADETIAMTVGTGGGPYTATITVPATATIGDCRLRTRITFNTPPVSCNASQFGETEDYLINVVAPLPVELLSFSGKAVGHTNVLSWTTANELNNDRFEIETKRNDGFEKMGSIEGSGTTTTDQQYNYVDKNPAEGINYYRLKQIDFDGQSSYSDVIAIASTFAERYEIYPNPVQQSLTVRQHTEGNAAAEFIVINAVGAIIQVPVISKTEKSTILDVSILPVGVYFLQIKGDNGMMTERFVKS